MWLYGGLAWCFINNLSGIMARAPHSDFFITAMHIPQQLEETRIPIGIRLHHDICKTHLCFVSVTSSRLMGSRNRTPGAELATGLGPLKSSTGLHAEDFNERRSDITPCTLLLQDLLPRQLDWLPVCWQACRF